MSIPIERLLLILEAGEYYCSLTAEFSAKLDAAIAQGLTLEALAEELMFSSLGNIAPKHYAVLMTERRRYDETIGRIRRNQRYVDRKKQGLGKKPKQHFAYKNLPKDSDEYFAELARSLNPGVKIAEPEAKAEPKVRFIPHDKAAPQGVEPKHSDYDPTEDEAYAKPPLEF